MAVTVTVSGNWGKDPKLGWFLDLVDDEHATAVFDGKLQDTGDPHVLVPKALAAAGLKHAQYTVLLAINRNHGDDEEIMAMVKKNIERAEQALEEYEFWMQKAVHAGRV